MFKKLELQSTKPGEQLGELLDYYQEDDIQVEIKTPTFFSFLRFPNGIHVDLHQQHISLQSEDGVIEFNQNNVKEVTDTFFHEEIKWRVAAYAVELEDGTEIKIDVLD